MIETPGYVVIPVAGGIVFAVVSPDGTVLSEHKTYRSALQKCRRLNRKADGE